MRERGEKGVSLGKLGKYQWVTKEITTHKAHMPNEWRNAVMTKGISGGEVCLFCGGDGVEGFLAAEFHKDKGFGWGKLGKNQRVTGKKQLNKQT